MTTFTIIADCLGGTFVSQYEVCDQNAALKEWTRNPPRELLSLIRSKVGPVSQVSLEDIPVSEMLALEPLKNLSAVWGGHIVLRGVDVFLNVVRTQIDG